MAERSTAFTRVREGLRRAREHHRGERTLTVRDVELPDPPGKMSAAQILRLRSQVLGVSQGVFARIVGGSVKTVQAWEQGATKPSGCALRLLRLIEQEPELARRMLRPTGTKKLAATRARTVGTKSTPGKAKRWRAAAREARRLAASSH